MHAIRLHAFGPPENLRYEEVDDPSPGAGQVRIRVRVAGIHLVDTAIRSGRDMGAFPRPDLPAIPGREVAGVVDAVGTSVDEEWMGRRVVAHMGFASGGYAELAVRDVAAVHVVPDAMADDVAVAMIGTGRTALAILDTAQLQPDDVVLVTAAAGGLGTLFVQAAANIGATVVGVAGGPVKVDVVRELGASVVVDYTEPGWPDIVRAQLAGREITAALDGVGGDIGRHALDLLGIGGRLHMFGYASGRHTPLSAAELFAKGLTVRAGPAPGLLHRPGGLRAFEERALAAAAQGTLRPVIGRPFPLAEAAQAHLAIEGRALVGKAVLQV